MRWPELREGVVEESRHYTTLDPLPEEDLDYEASIRNNVLGGSEVDWFVSARCVESCPLRDWKDFYILEGMFREGGGMYLF